MVIGLCLGVDLWTLLWLAVELYVLNSGARIDTSIEVGVELGFKEVANGE